MTDVDFILLEWGTILFPLSHPTTALSPSAIVADDCRWIGLLYKLRPACRHLQTRHSVRGLSRSESLEVMFILIKEKEAQYRALPYPREVL